ncbi:unnamed protein product [Protopolystoma xenopodis]|uniref:Uncharacterized protein n=1 Tax=Protopolystoma xenopodis TaxID=117903 RepID=A0A448WSA5_9PLAT|nr:unnamed protein product [Protopolystoma xenopodis]
MGPILSQLNKANSLGASLLMNDAKCIVSTGTKPDRSTGSRPCLGGLSTTDHIGSSPNAGGTSCAGFSLSNNSTLLDDPTSTANSGLLCTSGTHNSWQMSLLHQPTSSGAGLPPLLIPSTRLLSSSPAPLASASGPLEVGIARPASAVVSCDASSRHSSQEKDELLDANWPQLLGTLGDTLLASQDVLFSGRTQLETTAMPGWITRTETEVSINDGQMLPEEANLFLLHHLADHNREGEKNKEEDESTKMTRLLAGAELTTTQIQEQIDLTEVDSSACTPARLTTTRSEGESDGVGLGLADLAAIMPSLTNQIASMLLETGIETGFLESNFSEESVSKPLSVGNTEMARRLTGESALLRQACVGKASEAVKSAGHLGLDGLFFGCLDSTVQTPPGLEPISSGHEVVSNPAGLLSFGYNPSLGLNSLFPTSSASNSIVSPSRLSPIASQAQANNQRCFRPTRLLDNGSSVCLLVGESGPIGELSQWPKSDGLIEAGGAASGIGSVISARSEAALASGDCCQATA